MAEALACSRICLGVIPFAVVNEVVVINSESFYFLISSFVLDLVMIGQ